MAVISPAATAGSPFMNSRASASFAASKTTRPKVRSSASFVRPANTTRPAFVASDRRTKWRPTVSLSTFVQRAVSWYAGATRSR